MSDEKFADFIEWWWHKPKPGHKPIERRPADADDSILLSYITVAPLQVPLTAWDRGDYKVCIYSTLNTLSPLFPIFVGALLVPTPTSDGKRVNFQFSLSAYIGAMVFLILYTVLLIAAFPPPYRRLPREFYSLADLMAMCHQSSFMLDPDFDISSRDSTPDKKYMESRIHLRGSKYLFGSYRGLDAQWHMGFDVAQRRAPNFGPLETPLPTVTRITPYGWTDKLDRAKTAAASAGERAKTIRAEMGQSSFVLRARDVMRTVTTGAARAFTRDPRHVSVRTEFTRRRKTKGVDADADAGVDHGHGGGGSGIVPNDATDSAEWLPMVNIMSGGLGAPAMGAQDHARNDGDDVSSRPATAVPSVASSSGVQPAPATTDSRVRLVSPTVEDDGQSSRGSGF